MTNPQLGVDSDGDAVFGYTNFSLNTPYSGSSLYGATRTGSAAPSAEFRVSYGSSDCSSFYETLCPPEQVAVAPNGDALYAWVRGGTVQARARSAAGTFSPIENITTAGADVNTRSLRLDIDDQGDATFAWSTETAGDGDWVAQTRTRSASGALSAVQTLSGPSVEPMAPDVAVDDDGDAAFTWVRRINPGANYFQARTRSTAGTLSPTQNLEDPVNSYGFPGSRVAVDADGDATFVWVNYESNSTVRLTSRRRSRTGVLGSRKVLDTDKGYPFSFSYGSDVVTGGVDVVSAPNGATTVAWLDAPAQSSPVYRSRTESPEGVLGPAETVGQSATDYDLAIDAAVDREGDVTFAWNKAVSSGDYLQTRSRSAAGVASPTVNLGSAPRDPNAFPAPGPGVQGQISFPRVAVDDDGDATFEWVRRAPAGDGTTNGVESLQTRTRTTGGALGTTYNLTSMVFGSGPPIGSPFRAAAKADAARRLSRPVR